MKSYDQFGHCLLSAADLGNDFNAELTRVVSQLEKSRLETKMAASACGNAAVAAGPDGKVHQCRFFLFF